VSLKILLHLRRDEERVYHKYYTVILYQFSDKAMYIFGVDAHIQNLVGTQSYGLYFYYFNFVFLFQFINDPGIQNWNAQFVPKNRSIAGAHLVSLLKVKLLLALCFILITGVFACLFGYSDLQMMLFLCIKMNKC